MMHREHVWANGALVCNCGERRKPGASSTAPPGWPGPPSEPVCASNEPKHTILMTLGRTDGLGRKVELDGVDITSALRGVTVLEAHVHGIATVKLDLLPNSVIAALDDPDIVRAMTDEECSSQLRVHGWGILRPEEL